MVIVASLREVEKWRKHLLAQRGEEPKIYRTSIGGKNGMDRYENLDFFNPTWRIVLGIKGVELTEAEYRVEYNKILNAPKNKKRCFNFVQALDPNKDYILLCHCPPGTSFCHRYVLAEKIMLHRPDIEVEIH